MEILMRRLAALLLVASLFSGCTCNVINNSNCNDPSWNGIAPFAPEDMWSPAVKPAYHLEDGCGDPPESEKIEVLGPLKLKELVDIGLRNNPKTFKSWADARSAAYTWEISKAPYYPVVSDVESLTFIKQKFGGGSSASSSSSTATGNSVVDSSVTAGNGTGNGAVIADSGGTQYNQEIIHHLMISYLLLDFGGRDGVYESTRQALIAADWSHNRVIQDVIINIMQSYVNYMQTKALVEAKEEQLKDASTSAIAAENQYLAGVKTKVDYLLAKSNLVNVQLQLEDLRGQLKIRMGELAASLGVQASTILNLSPLPKDLPLKDVDASIEELMQVAMSERPDLSAAYAFYFQKEADVAVAQSDGLPKIRALGDIEGFNNIHVPSQNGYLLSAGIEIDIPIFAGFLYENQIRRAKEDLRSALAALEDKQNTIALEVVTSYFTLKTAIQTLKSSEELLKYSQEAYDAAYAIYRTGTGTILDLLTAQTALANARATNINAKAGWVSSLANLAYATGVLVDEDVATAIKGRGGCNCN